MPGRRPGVAQHPRRGLRGRARQALLMHRSVAGPGAGACCCSVSHAGAGVRPPRVARRGRPAGTCAERGSRARFTRGGGCGSGARTTGCTLALPISPRPFLLARVAPSSTSQPACPPPGAAARAGAAAALPTEASLPATRGESSRSAARGAAAGCRGAAAPAGARGAPLPGGGGRGGGGGGGGAAGRRRRRRVAGRGRRRGGARHLRGRGAHVRARPGRCRALLLLACRAPGQAARARGWARGWAAPQQSLLPGPASRQAEPGALQYLESAQRRRQRLRGSHRRHRLHRARRGSVLVAKEVHHGVPLSARRAWRCL